MVNADTPPGSAVMYQAAANHTVNGVRVSWKIVPAVRETRLPHPPQRHTRPAATVVAVRPQFGHTGPVGQRSQSKKSIQASSPENHALNSAYEPADTADRAPTRDDPTSGGSEMDNPLL